MFSVVRNPLDVIPSFAYLIHMRSHSLVPNEKLHEEFPSWWDEWARTVAKYIQQNHDFVVNTLSEKIPTYIFRYEDLVTDPEPVLNECFRFILDVPSIEGTVVEKRIKEVCMQGTAGKQVYEMKNSTINLNKNEHMYSPELRKQLSEILKGYNMYYGYTNLSEGSEK